MTSSKKLSKNRLRLSYNRFILYDFSREDNECSHQYVNCIKYVLQIKKPFGVVCVFKPHFCSINERF